jgi:glycosyltransferase involved in cell wall biosynthesis
MKLTIVYHVYRNSLTLKKSLSILANQSDKNFELILIDDAATSNVSRIISEFDFSKFTKFTYIKHSQNLGHSISFNQVNNILNSSHVIYVGSNFVPHKNFVKVVNDVIAHHPTVDVISFKNVKNDCSCEVFTKLDNKMRLNLDSSMKDKIFSLNLLNKNQIQLSENMYAPLIFIYKALINFKK